MLLGQVLMKLFPYSSHLIVSSCQMLTTLNYLTVQYLLLWLLLLMINSHCGWLIALMINSHWEACMYIINLHVPMAAQKLLATRMFLLLYLPRWQHTLALLSLYPTCVHLLCQTSVASHYAPCEFRGVTLQWLCKYMAPCMCYSKLASYVHVPWVTKIACPS